MYSIKLSNMVSRGRGYFRFGSAASIFNRSFSAASTVGNADYDLTIVGCGVAGCATALRAAARGLKVAMLTSSPNPLECNSFWAQGGIIYKGKQDSPSMLASDIHTAGAGICHDPAVTKLSEEGPAIVEDILLSKSKVPFDRNENGELCITLEASHNCPRIIHWRDHTGKAIIESMHDAIKRHPNIEIRRCTTAVDLLTASNRPHQCVGVHAVESLPHQNESNTHTHNDHNHDGNIEGKPINIYSPFTVLATGGLGELYEHTSNPQGAKGEGVAMAYRIGAQVSSLEYVQFHPTTFCSPVPGERRFLLTEALRGEGGVLVDASGRQFAKDYDPRGELAPRDVVTRVVLAEMARQNAPHMFLDIATPKGNDAEWIRARFPSIYSHCLKRGVDITKEPMPIVPAAHYACGGVTTDLQGRVVRAGPDPHGLSSTIGGLYAAGEVACTGLHGANRLASTSLLEGLVWGASAADDIVDQATSPAASSSEGNFSSSSSVLIGNRPDGPYRSSSSSSLSSTSGENARDLQAVAESESLLGEIQRTMWSMVGPVRTRIGMYEAVKRLGHLHYRAEGLYYEHPHLVPLISLRNASYTALLVATSAHLNPCSVGTHHVVDGISRDGEEQRQGQGAPESRTNAEQEKAEAQARVEDPRTSVGAAAAVTLAAVSSAATAVVAAASSGSGSGGGMWHF